MLLEKACAFLRKIGRPDAAQRLENRPAEEWDRVSPGGVSKLSFLPKRMAVFQFLDECQCWSRTNEGAAYWIKVHDQCRAAEGAE